MYIYYLSLGSNLGNREQQLIRAAELIAARIGKVEAVSRFYYSEPWGFESEHPFCNNCMRVISPLAPHAMLRATQRIERELGRIEKSVNRHYHDRTIDIDLIRCFKTKGRKHTKREETNEAEKRKLKNDVAAYREVETMKEVFVQSKTLTLPHPLMAERAFVMEPLAEVLILP